MANRCFPTFLVALSLAGCSAPMLSGPEPGVTVTARVALRQDDGRRLLQTIEPWRKSDVALARVILYKVGTPDTEVARRDLNSTELNGTLTFSNLRRFSDYKIVSEAYTATSERIDNFEFVPASCTTPFSVTNISPVAIGDVALQLRNKGFSGASSGSAVNVLDGGLDEPTGPEAITVN